MGAMANAMIKDEQGILRVNPLLIEKAKLLKDVTDKIQKYDKAIGDGRSSVGLYSEALEGVLGKLSALPGPAGRAASAVSAFGTQLKALLLNPIMLAISGIVAGLALLGKVFVSTAEGAGVVKDLWAGLSAQGNVLRDRAVSLIDTFHNLFTGEFTAAADSFAKAVDFGGRAMSNAAKAAMELSAAQRELNKQLAFHVSEEADENLEIQKYLFLSKDKSLADQDRINMLQKSLDLMKLQGEKAAKFATEQFRIDSENAALKAKQSGIDAETIRIWIGLDQERQDQMLKGSTQLQDFYNRIGGSKAVSALEESYAKIAAANTELFQQGKRAASQLSTLTAEIAADNLKFWEDRWKNAEDIIEKEKKKEEELAKIRAKYAKEHHDQEITAFNEATKFIDEEIKRMEAAADIKFKTEIDLGKRLFDQNQTNAKRIWDAMLEADKKEIEQAKKKEEIKQRLIDAGFQGAQQGADAIFQMRTNRLNAEMTAELSNVNLTETQRLAISKKYAKEQQKIAITQAVINGALGVTNALATGAPIMRWIEAAAVAVATLAQIAIIKSQSFDGGVSSPTAITKSPPAQKVTSGSVGTILPQFSQLQLNAVPNVNPLSAEDITSILKGLPSPVVTVEDINRGQTNMKKVSVRANI
jgi:hypothetical protein